VLHGELDMVSWSGVPGHGARPGTGCGTGCTAGPGLAAQQVRD